MIWSRRNLPGLKLKLLLDLVKAKDALEEKQIIKILKTKPIRTGWIKKGGSLLVFGASHEKKLFFNLLILLKAILDLTLAHLKFGC